jgi:tetratricopeptide (TPR) repeat protein
MYEHYEPEKHVFVDREQHLAWMDDALKRCKKKSVVLHLRGIGGVGKSSLLEYWDNTIEPSIRLDCQQYTQFYNRLNVLAKEAVLLGIKLRRFDILWQIRQRFVEGVEPAKEKGREWAKEVLMAIPFIGSLTSIGNAISAVGKRITPKLREKYGDVGDWLQSRLGKNHMERLLEVLWKEPRHAEFLYLDAFLEDLKNRMTVDEPLLILLDHFEYVDSEKQLWRYRKRKITEAELWDIFLSSITNAVGVVAGRYSTSVHIKKDLDIQEVELTELDTESCVDLLNQQGIADIDLQNNIVSVSGGNPFVIKAMCDLVEVGILSSDDIENLRADTLEEVRLKTWRRLFSQAQDLLILVDRAGLLPFFNRRIMDIVAPEMKTDQWNRLIRLSFVRERGDGTWVLHKLAKELVLVELGNKLITLTEDIAGAIECVSTEESDFILRGMSISVRALASPDYAIKKLNIEALKILNTPVLPEFFELLNNVEIDTEKGKLEIQTLKGWALLNLSRYAEAEQILLETLEIAQKLTDTNPETYLVFVAQNLIDFAQLLWYTDRNSEAEESFIKSINIFRQLYANGKIKNFPDDVSLIWFWHVLLFFSIFLRNQGRMKQAEEVLQEALRLSDEFPETYEDPRYTRNQLENQIRSALALVQIDTGRLLEGEKTCREIINSPSFQEANELFRRNIYGILCRSLRFADRPDEANRALQKTFEINRKYFMKDPKMLVSWREYSTTLYIRAGLLKRIGKYSEAEMTLKEALQISKEYYTEENTGTVAMILDSLAILLRETNRFSEAEKMHQEAAEMLANIIDRGFDMYLRNVAHNLNNKAILLRQIDRTHEAEDAYQRALEIIKQYANQRPEFIRTSNRVSIILNNLGVLYRTTGRLSEAKQVHTEALEIRKELAEKSPEWFHRRVSTSLNNLGIVLVEKGETSRAEDFLMEALNQRTKLADKLPEFYQPRKAMTLNNLGILLRRENRLDDAEKAYRKAIEIYEEFVLKVPSVYKQNLKKILSNYSILLSEMDDKDDTIYQIVTRLENLGVEQIPSKEQWLEEEEENIDEV